MVLSKFFARFTKGERGGGGETNNNATNQIVGTKGKLATCRILMLDDTDFTLQVKMGCKGQLVLDKICEYINLQEKDYFGLRYLDENKQTHWLDASKQVASQLQTSPPHNLYFGVKFYPADPCKLHEEITRYQIFLQLKQDILQSRVPVQFDLSAELASYVIQSELGDYDPVQHTFGYVSEFRFVPNQTEDFENKVALLHRSLKGFTPARAEYKFLDKVKWLEMYGVDLHPVKGEGLDYYIGITPTGIMVYRDKQKLSNYLWTRIGKITHKNKQFVLRVQDRNNVENTFAFECNTKAACKHLWKCCVDHHTFYRLSSESQSYQPSHKFISLGSKHRFSGREKSADSTTERPPPPVNRRPSKRHQRRSSTESLPSICYDSESQGTEHGYQHLMGREREPKGRDRGYTSAPDSPGDKGIWEGRHKKGGLFTSGATGANSVISEQLFPRRQYESEADAMRWRQRQLAYGMGGFEEQCRVPAEYTDASESEAEYKHRRRRQRRSAENINAEYGLQGPFPLRPNGRSRSPSNKRAPEELAQHFRYVEALQDPLASPMMHDDIPYTVVQTAATSLKANAHRRHRSKSPRTRHQEMLEKAGQAAADIPDGLQPPIQPIYRARPKSQLTQNIPVENLQVSSPVQSIESQTAPIVKTTQRLPTVHYGHSATYYPNTQAYYPDIFFPNQVNAGPGNVNLVNGHSRDDSGVGIDSNSSSAQGSPGSAQHGLQSSSQQLQGSRNHTYETVGSFSHSTSRIRLQGAPPLPPLPMNYSKSQYMAPTICSDRLSSTYQRLPPADYNYYGQQQAPSKGKTTQI